MATAAKSGAGGPTAFLAGSWLYCPGRGCGRKARLTRDGRIGSHQHPWGGGKCSMSGQPIPEGATVRRPDEQDPTLFDELAEVVGAFGAELGLSTDVASAPAGPREIPLAEATWGMFGEVKGWGHSGSPAKHTGYLTKPPRLYTGGAGGNHKKPKFKGEPLLSFVIDEPGGDGCAGTSIGMYARPGATFRVLDPPADRPLTAKKYLGRRMPVADLRARDTFYLWDEPGKPRMHLQADPEPADDGCYALAVLVDRQITTRTLHGDDWVDVEDPERCPWQAAPAGSEPVSPVGTCPHCARPGMVWPDGYTLVHTEEQLAERRCGYRGGPAELDWIGHREPKYLLAEGLGLETTPIVGVLALEGDRWVGRDTGGTVLFDVHDHAAAEVAVCKAGLHRVSSYRLGVRATRAACMACKTPMVEAGSTLDGQVRWHCPHRDVKEHICDVEQVWPDPQRSAPAATNTGPVLDGLLADIDNPGYGNHGRRLAREAAQRYAAGLPLIRHRRKLGEQWTWVCPVPTCAILRDGHDTIREARAAWFTHCEEQRGKDHPAGFTPMWPDDVLPVEPQREERQVEQPRKAGRKRTGPPQAAIEIAEPVGNDWWDNSALYWEKCGLLHRETVRRSLGGLQETVAVLLVPQGYAFAIELAAMLKSVGGLDPSSTQVHVLSDAEAEAYQQRPAEAAEQATTRARQLGQTSATARRAAPAPRRYDPDSPWQRLTREAHDILATCGTDTDHQVVTWAAGVVYIQHAHDLLRYLSLGRKPADLHGALSGGTLDGRRLHSADGKGVVVTGYASDDEDAPRTVVVKASWPRVARLVEQALTVDPGLVERAWLAEGDRAAALRTKDRAAEDAANDAAVQVLADLWAVVRPSASARPPQELQPAIEVLPLFDLDGWGPARPTSSTDR